MPNESLPIYWRHVLIVNVGKLSCTDVILKLLKSTFQNIYLAPKKCWQNTIVVHWNFSPTANGHICMNPCPWMTKHDICQYWSDQHLYVNSIHIVQQICIVINTGQRLGTVFHSELIDNLRMGSSANYLFFSVDPHKGRGQRRIFYLASLPVGVVAWFLIKSVISR